MIVVAAVVVSVVVLVMVVMVVMAAVECGNGATRGDTFLIWAASSSEMLISTGCQGNRTRCQAHGTPGQGHPRSFLTPSPAYASIRPLFHLLFANFTIDGNDWRYDGAGGCHLARSGLFNYQSASNCWGSSWVLSVSCEEVNSTFPIVAVSFSVIISIDLVNEKRRRASSSQLSHPIVPHEWPLITDDSFVSLSLSPSFFLELFLSFFFQFFFHFRLFALKKMSCIFVWFNIGVNE